MHRTNVIVLKAINVWTDWPMAARTIVTSSLLIFSTYSAAWRVRAGFHTPAQVNIRLLFDDEVNHDDHDDDDDHDHDHDDDDVNHDNVDNCLEDSGRICSWRVQRDGMVLLQSPEHGDFSCCHWLSGD